jgi:predicted RNA-binding Zn-ribbon protein involved in translation (DUF1610 family)
METDVIGTTRDFIREKMKVRNAVKSVYDIQKLRISTGNRITQSFMQAAGIDPGMKKEELDKEVDKLLKSLVDEYDRVTDAYVAIFNNKGRIAKSIEHLGADITLIRSETDYRLVKMYRGLLENETEAVKLVDKFVKAHPMWDMFFKDVKGCGPLMSAVCIGYFDPSKARHVSCFWSYGGVGLYQDDDEGTDVNSPILVPIKLKKPKEIITADMAETEDISEQEITVTLTTPLPDYDFGMESPEKADFDYMMTQYIDGQIVSSLRPGMFVLNTFDKNPKSKIKGFRFWAFVDEEIGWQQMPPNIDKARVKTGGMRADGLWHLVDREYTNKSGDKAMKKSITYNPFVKTKLLGVLASSFLKCPGCKYEQIWREYRARKENDPSYKTYSGERKMRMSNRYAIKMFLKDLWVAWRTYEGLPVTKPYEEEFLGRNPHGFNF